MPITIQGTLQPDGSLKLDQVPNLAPGPVIVTLQPVPLVKEDEPAPEVREEFYSEAARLADTEEAFEAQRAIFRQWRNDPRFQAYWRVLDEALTRTFEQVQKWAASRAAIADLDDYDFDAFRKQREHDQQHAGDHIL